MARRPCRPVRTRTTGSHGPCPATTGRRRQPRAADGSRPWAARNRKDRPAMPAAPGDATDRPGRSCLRSWKSQTSAAGHPAAVLPATREQMPCRESRESRRPGRRHAVIGKHRRPTTGTARHAAESSPRSAGRCGHSGHRLTNQGACATCRPVGNAARSGNCPGHEAGDFRRLPPRPALSPRTTRTPPRSSGPGYRPSASWSSCRAPSVLTCASMAMVARRTGRMLSFLIFGTAKDFAAQVPQ